MIKGEILKTSENWQKEADVTIIDPDGWDRINFQYSWFEEKISKQEFEKRVCSSSIIGSKKNMEKSFTCDCGNDKFVCFVASNPFFRCMDCYTEYEFTVSGTDAVCFYKREFDKLSNSYKFPVFVIKRIEDFGKDEK